MRVAVIRKAHFNAAHRLYIPEWTHDKNMEIFGLCTSPNFHGHNYEFEVRVTGEVDPMTGIVINLKELKEIIRECVEEKFDHKNLNLDTQEFREMNPTAENICFVIWKILRAELNEKYDLSVKLQETPNNMVEYPA